MGESIKPLSDLGYGTEPAPTVETWGEFQQANPYASITGGYVDATYDMLQKLEKIVVINDFDQMKVEITKLYSERYEFLSHAINHPR